MTFAEAIRLALAEEMRRDPTVFIIGEDIGRGGGVFKVTVGLIDEFGPQRVIDSPISEAAIAGIGVGTAVTGMRPVVEIMFGDFITLAMDQIVNQAAKFRYMTGGQARVPMVVRTTLGAGRSSAATLAKPIRLAGPHPRLEGDNSVHALRCQGFAEERHPRR
jgi:pyruvate dehydrogenase E1 component beta subunit